tara:strand:+ start:608 stop:913 length:306 start_codon:yes stop_codon:yes gene_type:complete
VSQDFLAQSAADFFNIELSTLKSPCRKDKTTWPRNVCIHIAHKNGAHKSTIGRFWNRDRTVVYNSLKRVNEMLESYPKRQKEYADFLDFMETQKRKKEAGV